MSLTPNFLNPHWLELQLICFDYDVFCRNGKCDLELGKICSKEVITASIFPDFTNQQPPQRGDAVPGPIWVGRNGCWPSRGSQLPRALSFIFLLCCSMNDCRRAAHSFFKIGCLFSLFLFSHPSLALLRLLILLPLLMSGSAHPNPGPIFPCSVCAGNVTWRGKSVQCCACSKWVHLRCSQLFISQCRALGSSHSWSCPPCRILGLHGLLPCLHPSEGVG